MGNSPATPKLSQEQADIQYLGARYPFGDDELRKLYRIFQRLKQKQEGRVSFIADWAVEAVELTREQQALEDAEKILEELRNERSKLIQVVEDKILPEGFSEQLYKTSFSRPQNNGIGGGVASSSGPETDESRMERLLKDQREQLDAFFAGVSNAGRRGGRHALEILFKFYEVPIDSNDDPGFNSVKRLADCNRILNLAYRLSLASAFLDSAKRGEEIEVWLPPEHPDKKAIRGLSQSVIEFIKRKRTRESPYGTAGEDPDLEKGFVELLDLQEWAEGTAPVLSSSISTFMFFLLFPDRPYPPSRTAFQFPQLPADSSFFTEPTSPLLFSFACLSTSLNGMWHRLYASSNDGLSFNRMQNALLGYAGPTLIIIRAINGGIFGAFTASPWKESKDFYGNSDCFLYQLIPMTAVYRPCGQGSNFMYCNSEARSRGYDGQAHGIGFGGDVDQPRVLITETFENCIARSQDLTFEYGLLLPKTPEGAMQKNFDIDALEVWGVGGDEIVGEALGARDRQREITAANLRKARKVDKAAFLEDFRSGVIESKAFAYRDQIRGRADAAVDDRHQNAYVYEN